MSNANRRKRLPVGRRGLVAVAGDPDAAARPSSLARTAASSDPPWPGDQVQFLQVADGVDLDQVDVVGLQPLQAVVDLGPGRFAVA